MPAPRLTAALFALASGLAFAADGLVVDEAVLERERRRVEVVEQVSRPTIAIFEASGQNGGSGVIVSEDGYAVTNFHVVAPCGPRMTCATSDGETHDAVLVGVDPVGDIALIKLLGEDPFTAAEIGDSDDARVGDEAIVAGNPFLLAEDYRPSISVGVISGVHRYQPPAETLLEYADCLQTDAAINPGNSGGPLFDADGRLIGVNGRGSFEKRGRVNVGFGYAVSINQVMRFVPQLKAGRIVNHATLGATVRTVRREAGTVCLVDAVDTLSEAYRRGLRPGDELVEFGGGEVRTANRFLNRLGVLPAGWRTRIAWRRFVDGRVETQRGDVRLAASHPPGQLAAAVAKQMAAAPSESDDAPGAWTDWYEARDGYANHRFARLETERLVDAWSRATGPRPTGWDMTLSGPADERIRVTISADGVSWESSKARLRLDAGRAFDEQPTPPGAPGLLASLWLWRSLLVDGSAGLEEATYHGRLPFEADEAPGPVLRVRHRGAVADFYFAAASNRLVGVETSLDSVRDAARLSLGDDRSTEFADAWPHRWSVAVGERAYGDFQVDEAAR